MAIKYAQWGSFFLAKIMKNRASWDRNIYHEWVETIFLESLFNGMRKYIKFQGNKTNLRKKLNRNAVPKNRAIDSQLVSICVIISKHKHPDVSDDAFKQIKKNLTTKNVVHTKTQRMVNDLKPLREFSLVCFFCVFSLNAQVYRVIAKHRSIYLKPFILIVYLDSCCCIPHIFHSLWTWWACAFGTQA